jgi:aminopeptidase N
MVVFSNGRKVSEETDAETGRIAVRWRQEKPHVNYLISLVAGHFETIEDRYGDIPLAFHTPPSDIGEAPNSFEGTKEMMAFFEEEIGVPYPWAKYDQVVIRDFMWGGMENTSLTTLTDRTLFTKETENIRSSQSLVAHELAHQWFGDLVTCRDWSHIWLNEGFATYYDVLYDGHRNGRDQLLYRMYETGQSLIGRSGTPRPIVSRLFGEAVDQFRSHGYLAYGKGSWILHMLRNQLGETLYRECIRTFLERHQFDTVTTADLVSVLEEISGRSFDRFFDQWVFHAHHPELKVSYAWDQQARLARVSVVQEQDVSDGVLLFHFPLAIRFLVQDRTEDREVRVRSRTQDFYFPFTEAPELVRIDPELALLARVDFDVPAPMLAVQLRRESDVIGRLLAVEQHGRRKGARDVEALREVLNSDPFHGVRMAASEALRRIHSDEALEALLASLDQSDARVRNQVVRDLGGFYHPDALETVLRVAATEGNPMIRGEAVRGAGRYAASEVREQLVGLLRSESHRNHLVGDAIVAMRRQDDPVYVEPLMGMLGQRGGELTSRGFAEGLEALAFLARHEKEKAEVREFISDYLNEKREPVQLAAIRSLGMLGDPRAAAALEAFAGAGRENRQREVAVDALRELRAGDRPAVVLGELRSEVLELKRINETLRRSLDELKKKVEAKWSEKAEGAPDKPAVKPLHSPRGAQQAR